MKKWRVTMNILSKKIRNSNKKSYEVFELYKEISLIMDRVNQSLGRNAITKSGSASSLNVKLTNNYERYSTQKI